jgi:hypothetical protein
MLTAHVAHARGSLARPLSDRELEAKLRDLAAYGAPGVDAGGLIEAIWAIDQAMSMSNVMGMSAATAG